MTPFPIGQPIPPGSMPTARPDSSIAYPTQPPQSPLSLMGGQQGGGSPLGILGQAFGQQSPYNTQLPPLMESQFQQWAGNNKFPISQPGSPTPYDLRGLYQGIQDGHPHASGFEPSSGSFPSYWTTPLHSSFSNQSKWFGL